MQDVGKASGAAEETVWVYLSEIPAENIAEYGRVLLTPAARMRFCIQLLARDDRPDFSGRSI